MTPDVDKVVLAYSGGLDTSVILKWLEIEYGCEIVTFTADLGQGEELDRLEEFRPEGLAQRILGMGDVVGLMKDFEKHVDQETAQSDAEKMMSGKFGYDDFIRQLQSIRKMGQMDVAVLEAGSLGSVPALNS